MSFKNNTSRGPLNCEKRSTLNHFIRSRNGWRYASMHQTITLVFLGLFISSSFALRKYISNILCNSLQASNGIYLLQHKLEPCHIFITLALRIPADISYSRDGNSKLELFLSPEDTFQMMQLLTSKDDRLKFQQDSLQQKHQQKVSSAALIHTPFIYLN